VGLCVGLGVGCIDGVAEGDTLGEADGRALGEEEGCDDGWLLGAMLIVGAGVAIARIDEVRVSWTSSTCVRTMATMPAAKTTEAATAAILPLRRLMAICNTDTQSENHGNAL